MSSNQITFLTLRIPIEMGRKHYVNLDAQENYSNTHRPYIPPVNIIIDSREDRIGGCCGSCEEATSTAGAKNNPSESYPMLLLQLRDGISW